MISWLIHVYGNTDQCVYLDDVFDVETSAFYVEIPTFYFNR